MYVFMFLCCLFVQFLMSGLYDMHGILYCALMGIASAAAPVLAGREQKLA